MSGLSGRADLFESFLAECFDVCPSSSHNNASLGSACPSVMESVDDFDLSLLGPVEEGESAAKAATVVAFRGAALGRDSVKLRIYEIEDRLGVHQFAFWRASPSVAVSLLVSLCREELGLQIEEADVTLVRELDCRRCGVLLRVPTVVLKQQILAARDIFKLRGYFVDLA